MSCPLDKVLNQETQAKIDVGVKFMADQVMTVRKMFNAPSGIPSVKKESLFENCASTKLNKGVLWTNIALQITVLVFLVFIAITKGEKDWSIDALTWISWITLALVIVQYKDVLVSSFKLFLYGVSKRTQIITLMSLAIVLLTKLLYVNEGWAVSAVALSVFILIAIRVGFQIQSVLTEESIVPVFLDFINRVITTKRINDIRTAFI